MNDYEDLMELTDKQLWDQLPNVDGELKSDFLYELSRRSFEKSDYKSALALAEQARDILLELKDLTSDAEILKIYRAIGMNAHALDNPDLVISTLEKALDIAKRSNLDKPDDFVIDGYSNSDLGLCCKDITDTGKIYLKDKALIMEFTSFNDYRIKIYNQIYGPVFESNLFQELTWGDNQIYDPEEIYEQSEK